MTCCRRRVPPVQAGIPREGAGESSSLGHVGARLQLKPGPEIMPGAVLHRSQLCGDVVFAFRSRQHRLAEGALRICAGRRCHSGGSGTIATAAVPGRRSPFDYFTIRTFGGIITGRCRWLCTSAATATEASPAAEAGKLWLVPVLLAVGLTRGSTVVSAAQTAVFARCHAIGAVRAAFNCDRRTLRHNSLPFPAGCRCCGRGLCLAHRRVGCGFMQAAAGVRGFQSAQKARAWRRTGCDRGMCGLGRFVLGGAAALVQPPPGTPETDASAP